MGAYVAMTNWPGCLPDTAEDLPAFKKAEEAWTYLVEGLSEDDRYVLDDEEDPFGTSSESELGLELEAKAGMRMPDGKPYNFTGTVYGPNGYGYSVEWDEDAEPGEFGPTLDCGCRSHITRYGGTGVYCETEQNGYCNFECPHEDDE